MNCASCEAAGKQVTATRLIEKGGRQIPACDDCAAPWIPHDAKPHPPATEPSDASGLGDAPPGNEKESEMSFPSKKIDE
jgi:ribosome-binding protein aMBF1 (putative translation factor)